MTELILVTGAGGFIGGQLVRDLERQNFEVRAVDRKPLKNWYYESSTAENLVLDLKEMGSCRLATNGATLVYNFAADMGGMGFMSTTKSRTLSVLNNTHLMASQESAKRYFFSSRLRHPTIDKAKPP
jgi:nucleoside-diphosphate-sugar epimerase